MLAHFFRTDKVTFSMSSANPDALTPRWYTRFSDAAEDIVNARIYQGIHFRFADEVPFQAGHACGRLDIQPLPPTGQPMILAYGCVAVADASHRREPIRYSHWRRLNSTYSATDSVTIRIKVAG